MAGFMDAHKRATDKSRQEEQGCVPGFLEGFPNLTACLMGYEEKPGLMKKGMTLTLYYMDGRLKFSVKDKETNVVGFGIVKESRSLSDGLEVALAGEEVEWKEMPDNQKRR